MMNRPLRIGFDVAQTCQERAGCGWYADSLAHALVTAEPENEYYLYHHFGGWFNDRTDTGTRIDAPRVHSPLCDLSLQEAAAFWEGVRAGRTPLPGEPDIVHANTYQAPPVGNCAAGLHGVRRELLGAPGVHDRREPLALSGRGFRRVAARGRFPFHLGEQPPGVRAHPAGLAGTQRQTVGRYTPLGQRERPETAESPAAPGASGGDFWLAVGTLEPRKNYETLLDALDLYWSRSPRPRPLRIAGGGGWKSDALKEHLAALETLGRVERLGYVPDAELLRLYASAQALVFPSWHEGFGLPVLEALGQGAPVICSNRASLPEVGGEAAVYVDPGSAESICRAMLDLEADPTRRAQLVEAGRRQAERFSWERTARETLAFYRRVLARK